MFWGLKRKNKNMVTRVAINGFGRIGRSFFKVALKRPEIEIVAINDLGDIDNLAYLLKYDSVYGQEGLDIKTERGAGPSDPSFLIVNGKKINFVQQKDPANLPWKDLNIDVAVESTGFFESYEAASAHIKAGAKRVVITAPAKDKPGSTVVGRTVLIGVNEDELAGCEVTSNGSCTTNSSSPVIQIMHETIGVKKAFLSTVHGYTATQKLVDSPDAKDWRRGRAGAVNIVPSSTGAAISVTEAVKELKGKFDGIAIRVPTPTGSLADITFVAGRPTSVQEINDIFRKASEDPRWKPVMGVINEQVVSTDIVGSEKASIVDLTLTKVIDGDLVKVMAWYDNERGYCYALTEHVIRAGKLIK